MRKRTHKTRRLFPCPACDIEGIQCWLEEMETQGWALWKIAYIGTVPLYAVFRETNRRTVRYRLHPADDFFPAVNGPYDADRDQQNAYREFGWDYVTRLTDFYVYRTADPVLPELHTDPKVQAIAVTQLQKRCGRYLQLSILGVLVSGRSLVRDWAIIQSTCGPAVFFAYIAAWVMEHGYLLAKLQYYRQSVAELSAGKPLPPMKHRRLWRGLLPVIVLLFIFSLSSMLWVSWRSSP